MTPKRYFAFGCLTILIQGGVLASQNSLPELQLSSGSAMGSSQTVSISIAMQASQAVKTPKQVNAPAETKAKPAPRVEEIAKAHSLTQPLMEKSIARPQPIAKPNAIAQTQTKQVTAQKSEPVKAKKIEKVTEVAVAPATAEQEAHNQPKVEAKQGVSKQTIALSKPTFSSPPTQPHYPKKARKKGFQGTATVEVMFNQLGEQLSLTLVDSSGYHLLDKAALSAVEEWQFSAPKPQTAYAYTVRVPVKFALN